jgi:glycosyltransferase involved in cell wall biosynthesis
MENLNPSTQPNLRSLSIVFLDFDDIKNPLLAAGQAHATLEVGQRLIKRGHKLTVVCSKYPGYQDRVDENGIEYKHIGLASSKIRLNNIIYIFVLPFWVRKIKADIIVECFTPPFSTLFSPLFTKIPVVALPTSFEASRFSKVYHLPFPWIEKIGLKYYKYFLPYTKALDMKMKKVNPKIISKIVSEGVGQDFFQIEKKQPEYILFLGRFDMSQKGIDLLLEAYAKVVNQVKWPLLIVGKGLDEAKIKTLIEKLGLTDKVQIRGAAYGQEKYQILSKALFITFPSRHEGFSLFSLEALASGLKLVAFDIPGLSWATDPQIVAKANKFDVDAYSKLLLEASNDEKIDTISVRTREFAKQFTWEKVSLEFESFFKDVLEMERMKQ